MGNLLIDQAKPSWIQNRNKPKSASKLFSDLIMTSQQWWALNCTWWFNFIVLNFREMFKNLISSAVVFKLLLKIKWLNLIFLEENRAVLRKRKYFTGGKSLKKKSCNVSVINGRSLIILNNFNHYWFGDVWDSQIDWQAL